MQYVIYIFVEVHFGNEICESFSETLEVTVGEMINYFVESVDLNDHILDIVIFRDQLFHTSFVSLVELG